MRVRELADQAKVIRRTIQSFMKELMREGLLATHGELVSAENNMKKVQWDLEGRADAEERKVRN